jgi:hypothetical protein
MTEVCDAFAALTGEIRAAVEELREGVEDLLSSSTSRESRDAREITSLQFENHILHGEIESEAQWMKRVAFDVLDSEQGTLIIGVRAIWVLSENSCNAMDVLRSRPVMTSLIDLLTAETRQELVQASLGILGNLCQSPQSRDLFVEKYDQDLTRVAIQRAIILIDAAIDPFSKTLELGLIFLHNSSLHEGIADLMRRSDTLRVLIGALEKVQENLNLFDTIVATLNELYHSESGIAYLVPPRTEALVRLLENRPPTSGIVQLMTTIRIAFQRIECPVTPFSPP